MSKIKLYRHPLSGHAHRVELLLSLLNIDAEIINIDLMKGEQKSSEFLMKNPDGQVPALEDGDSYFSDSNAILVYLATKYDKERLWLPTSAEEASEVQKYLTVAAGAIAFGPAAARLVTLFGAGLDAETAINTANNVLGKLNARLQNREWLATNHVTIADVANYAYIAVAPEGNVSLDDYPNVITWLKRMESLPGFVPMHASSVGLSA
jgi:glutathione S-transferase